MRLGWSKMATHAEKFLISIYQASRRARGGFSFPFAKLTDTFQPFGFVISVEYYVYTNHLGQMFVRFLTSTFYFY